MVRIGRVARVIIMARVTTSSKTQGLLVWTTQ